MHYYNEIEPYAAEWLKNLIAAKLLPEGHVDTRDIRDVHPSDLKGYIACHFFAGLGGWAYALRLAGWPDDRSVWTGSCPCQPFSAAGRRGGFADERHLWPAWFWLIAQCRPDIVFGEQVEGATDWLDLVSTDLEGEGYAVGAAVLPAASVGAPHGRHRLWFVADAAGERRTREHALLLGTESRRDAADCVEVAGGGEDGELAYTHGGSCQQRRPINGGRNQGSHADTRAGSGGDGMSRVMGHAHPRSQGRRVLPERTGECVTGATSVAGGLADADLNLPGNRELQRSGRLVQSPQDPPVSFWTACDWLPCQDGKFRPVEPGTFPLAHGIPARVGRLRAYGNAIVPQAAAIFIQASYL